MKRHAELLVAVIFIVSAVIGSAITIDSRYAKAGQVKAQLEDYYIRSLQLRILEIDLKENPTPSEKALKQYLQQEIHKITD